MNGNWVLLWKRAVGGNLPTTLLRRNVQDVATAASSARRTTFIASNSRRERAAGAAENRDANARLSRLPDRPFLSTSKSNFLSIILFAPSRGARVEALASSEAVRILKDRRTERLLETLLITSG